MRVNGENAPSPERFLFDFLFALVSNCRSIQRFIAVFEAGLRTPLRTRLFEGYIWGK